MKKVASVSGVNNGSADSRTLGRVFEATHLSVWKGTKGEDTAVVNAECAVGFFGKGTPVDGISARDIDNFVVSLQEAGNAPGTINRKLAALSRIMNFAVERGLLDEVPHIARRKEPKNRVRWLTKEEEVKLLASLGDDMRDLAVFLIDTGCRLGEALGSVWSDFQTGMVTFWETKGGDPRTIPMTQRVKNMVSRRFTTAPFSDQAGPFSCLDHDRVTYLWNKTREMIGFASDDQFVPHMLRHTCASRLVQRGVPIITVKEWLGHKDIKMTMRYAHLAPQNLLDAVKMLEAA